MTTTRFSRHWWPLALALCLGACAEMPHSTQRMAVGAAVGAVAGAALTYGDPLATVGGAAIGAVIGSQTRGRR